MEFPNEALPSNPKMEGGRVEQPTPTWFFEREDGSVISCQEAEAWRIYSGKNQTIGQYPKRLKMLGVSDGKLYYRAIIEARDIFKKEGLEKAQERIRQGFTEELEHARGNLIRPRDFDTIGRNGDAVRVQDLLN